MKLQHKLSLIVLTMALLSPIAVTAKGSQAGGGNNQSVAAQLTVAEEATLLWMREEEKLARDVYLMMDKFWRKPVFGNIADSEQNHMDALLKRLNEFGLEDPVVSNKIGVFGNPDISALYDALVAEGSKSYIDALRVGATIEDMDIQDLMAAIEETDKLSLQTTYQNLLEGSKNHLRAFVGLLEQQGVTYQPDYIDQDLFDAIINF